MSHRFERLLRRRPVARSPAIRPLVPADPAASGAWHDPSIAGIRAGLGPFRRRLWIRRIVRRAWLVAALALLAEAALWALARLIPLERAPLIAAAIPVVAVVALSIVAGLARPSIGETAIAVDVEGGLRDRLTSALALAGDGQTTEGDRAVTGDPLDGTPGRDRQSDLLQRQRQDAVHALRAAPTDLFRPRARRAPMAAALVSALLLVPLLALPNTMDQRIAQDKAIREEAARQADRIDKAAEDLAARGRDPNDPRTRLAQELRDLALQLRDHPTELDANLAKLGSVEGDLRAAIDPATEQRAAALASLSRALSGATTGKPDTNRDGDPDKAAADIEKAAAELDKLTPEQQAELARRLTELQGTAQQAAGAAGTAAREAAQSLAGGDTAGAKDALGRLADAVRDADRNVAVNRDLAGAASRLQDSRRSLADAARPGDQVAGQPNPSAGTGQGQGSPNPSGGTGQGQGSPNPSGGPARGRARGPGAGGQGQGQGAGAGAGAGQGRGRGRGRARARGRGGRGQGQGAGARDPSAAAGRTPASWAAESVATAASVDPPRATSPPSSGPTSEPSTPRSTGSAGPAIRPTWPAPAATARPSRAARRAAARPTRC